MGIDTAFEGETWFTDLAMKLAYGSIRQQNEYLSRL